jgi:hypothetical protein
VSTGDLDRVPAFISPACVEVYDNVRHAHGVEGARQHILTVTAVNIDRVHDGRIVEHGGAANLLEPLLRIGAIRVVGPSAAAG